MAKKAFSIETEAIISFAAKKMFEQEHALKTAQLATEVISLCVSSINASPRKINRLNKQLAKLLVQGEQLAAIGAEEITTARTRNEGIIKKALLSNRKLKIGRK